LDLIANPPTRMMLSPVKTQLGEKSIDCRIMILRLSNEEIQSLQELDVMKGNSVDLGLKVCQTVGEI